jgi:TIR domain
MAFWKEVEKVAEKVERETLRVVHSPEIVKVAPEIAKVAEKVERETRRVVRHGEHIVHGIDINEDLKSSREALQQETHRANAAEERAEKAEAALEGGTSEYFDPWELGNLPTLQDLIVAREAVVSAQHDVESIERKLDLLDVFLSHNGANKDVLLWLNLMLRICGVRTFFDLGAVTRGIDADLKSGLARSEVLLAWLSPSFFSTDYPSKETWTFACSFGLNRVLLYSADGMEIPQLQQAGLKVDTSRACASPGGDPIFAEPAHGGLPLGHVLSKHRVEMAFKDQKELNGGHFRSILLDIVEALPATSRAHITIPTVAQARQLGMLVHANIGMLIEDHGDVYKIKRDHLDKTIEDVQGMMSFTSAPAPSAEENATTHDNNHDSA